MQTDTSSMGFLPRLVRELVESVGFFAGLAFSAWGIDSPEESTIWMILALWPFLGLIPPLVGPRHFRTTLILVGAALIVGYGNAVWTSSIEPRTLAAGGGLLIAGLFLTPRTQRALVGLRLILAGIIVGTYIAVFFFIEPSFGTGGAIIIIPFMIPILIGLLVRTRPYLRAASRSEWHEPPYLHFPSQEIVVKASFD